MITDPRYAAWITPPTPAARRSTADGPAVRSGRGSSAPSADTLYLLSQEGPASAAFVTTALNAAIDRAAIAYARTPARQATDQPAAVDPRRGREHHPRHHAAGQGQPLRLPRAAHGHRAAVLVPGRGGVGRARDAQAVVRGQRQDLPRRRRRDRVPQVDVGPARRPRRAVLDLAAATAPALAPGASSTSTAEQLRRVPIMSVAELAALPRGRALLFSTGNRPALGRPTPWMTGAVRRADPRLAGQVGIRGRPRPARRRDRARPTPRPVWRS